MTGSDPRAKPPDPPAGSVIRVMVVDDSAVIRGLFARALEHDPEIRVVASVGDGRMAVDTVKRHEIDVVVLDIEMPVMNGMEFLVWLRGAPGGDHPKVVFCTTENDLAHIQQAMSAGADEYIMKPFDAAIIQSKFTQVGLL